MSLEPMLKPSKMSRNSSASSAFDGTSHIMMTFRPVLALHQAVVAQHLDHLAAFVQVRTNGIITHRLSRPMSSRTRFDRLHSSANAS